MMSDELGRWLGMSRTHAIMSSTTGCGVDGQHNNHQLHSTELVLREVCECGVMGGKCTNRALSTLVGG